MFAAIRRPLLAGLIVAAALTLAPAAGFADSSTNVGRIETAANARWAVVAFSSRTGRWGTGYNYSSYDEAAKAALRNCGSYDAQVVLYTNHGYIAIAEGSGTATGWGYGDTPEVAKAHALRACLKRTCCARVTYCRSVRG